MGLELLGFLPYCNNLIITWYDIILLNYTPVFDDCKYLFLIFLHFSFKNRYCSLVPRSSNGFCRCFAFQIGKICYHHCIIRHFQFRKCLPVNSNQKSCKIITPPYPVNHNQIFLTQTSDLLFYYHKIHCPVLLFE